MISFSGVFGAVCMCVSVFMYLLSVRIHFLYANDILRSSFECGTSFTDWQNTKLSPLNWITDRFASTNDFCWTNNRGTGVLILIWIKTHSEIIIYSSFYSNNDETLINSFCSFRIVFLWRGSIWNSFLFHRCAHKNVSHLAIWSYSFFFSPFFAG